MPCMRRAAASSCGHASACARTRSPLNNAAALRRVPQLYEIVPQVLLPVLPHLKSELEVEDDSKRAAAVDLVARLFLHVRARLHVCVVCVRACVFCRRQGTRGGG